MNLPAGHGVRAVLVYCALLLVGIPWYWPGDDRTLLFGVPAWVCVAIAASLVASAFTAWRLLTYADRAESPESDH